jgi:predicted Zn-dependent peptidase
MTRSYQVIERNGRKYNMLGLPGTNFFKFEIINMYGSHIERLYEERYGKNVYGISHFIEHLGFRATKDFKTTELLSLIKNEGTYNASTDYDRINYWFQTTMDRIDLGIKLVANYSLNTLDKIPAAEFDIEKKVVYNEAKRYADDDQTMFWFDSTRALTGYKEEDNVIGIPETIDTFTQEDCIKIKDMFLSNAKNVYNVTFDSSILTCEEVIDKIEAELNRHQPLGIAEPVTQEEYNNVVLLPQTIISKLENDSEQHMTLLNMDVVSERITADSANAYLSNYAEDTSLNDVIREQNGLTYGIHFGSDNISYKPYTYFGCDVSKGTEDLLMELFEDSINKSVDAWSQEAYEKFMNAKRLKRTMSLLDQKNYGSWHSTATWHPEVIEELKDVLSTDLDAAYDVMDERYSTFEAIGEYLETVRKTVNSKDYGLVTN